MPAAQPKSKSLLGFVVVVVIIMVIGWVLLAVGNATDVATVSTDTTPNPSIDNTRASGSKGFFDWTKALGYQPKAMESSYAHLPTNASVLICIAPNMQSTNLAALGTGIADEAEGITVNQNPVTYQDGLEARDWIAAGHTMLLFASSLPGATVSAYHESEGKSGANTFAGALGVFPQSAIETSDTHKGYMPLQPSKWTQGVNWINTHPGFRLYDPDHHGTPLFADVIDHGASAGAGIARYHAYPIAEVYPIGKGRVIAVSDDFFACNRNLIRADNAAFLYQILSLTTHPGDTILFDEYHHAFGVESPSLWLALAKPVRYATLQLALVLFVAFLVLMVRVGRPVPAAGATGRSSAEYVTSLAGLYQSAGVTTTALETIYRQFLREVCQKFGLPTDTTLEKMAEIAARRGGVDRDGLKRLLISCEKSLAASVAINGRDLVILASAIERYRKELGIG